MQRLLEVEVPSQVRCQKMIGVLWDLRGLPALYMISGRLTWVATYRERKAELAKLVQEARESAVDEKEVSLLDEFSGRLRSFHAVNERIQRKQRRGGTDGLITLVLKDSYERLQPAEAKLEEIGKRSVDRAKRLQQRSVRLRNKMKYTAWAAVVGYGLALVAVLIIGARMATRLARLERGVRLVGRGALAHRLPARGRDEIARIERGFNSMAESLGRARERLKRFGQVDGLTGAYNRHYLRRELSRRPRHDKLAVILFDIDHFKRYNDTNGHPAGDEALKKVARLARRCCGRKGVVVRYGGEEFLVLLPGGREERARRLAEDIRRRIAKARFAGERRQPGGRLTVSLGLAAGGVVARRGLIKAADEALYRSKRQGRNRVS